MLAGLIVGSAMVAGCEEQPDTRTAPRTGTGTADRDYDSTTGGMAGVDQNVQARARTLIDQVNQHIRNKEFSAAETVLRELEGLKGSLPQATQTQITTLRSSLNTAKANATRPPVTTPPAKDDDLQSPTTPPPTEP
jgi:hypothetical protein